MPFDITLNFAITDNQLIPKTFVNILVFSGFDLHTSSPLHGGVSAYLRHDISYTRFQFMKNISLIQTKL